jgi:hypothetical protein
MRGKGEIPKKDQRGSLANQKKLQVVLQKWWWRLK